MEEQKTVSMHQMKRSNRRALFNQVYEKGAISRPQLSHLTGMSVMTVGRIADELIALGLLCEQESTENASQGRPPRLLSIRREPTLCLGMFIDREGVEICAADAYGKVVHQEDLMLDLPAMQPSQVAQTLADHVLALREVLPLQPSLGVTLPGIIDPASGVVGFSSQLKWRDVPLGDMLQTLLPGTFISIDNDVKACALAEMKFGEARNHANSVLLSIGSGIGAAVVINNTLYRGLNNLAGEIGHISIGNNERMCECGHMGCLQTKVADFSILQQARVTRPGITMQGVLDAYESRASWALMLVEQMAQSLAMVVNLLVCSYSPDVVVVGGSMTRYFPLLTSQAEAYRQKHLNVLSGSTLDLRVSEFGALSNRIGAAAIAYQRVIAETI